MSSTLLALANPAYLSAQDQQSQAQLEYQQKVLADYLAHDKEEEEEAELSDSDEEEGEGDEEMVDAKEEEEDDEEDEEEVDVEKVLSEHLGGEGWEKKAKSQLDAAFFALRERIRKLELQVCAITGRTPRWGPGDDQDVDDAEDNTGTHLASWLGELTEADLEKARKGEVIWWLVDMCKAMDAMRLPFQGLVSE